MACRGTLKPEEQAYITTNYQPGRRGHGILAIAKALDRPRATIQHAIERVKCTGSSEQHPVGRKHKLTEAEEESARKRLDADPTLTNAKLAAPFAGRVTDRTITNVLRRGTPPFTRKRFADEEPGEETHEWKAEVKSFIERTRRDLPIAQRIYGDECAIFANEVIRVGRSRRGKRITRYHTRYAKKFTLHVFAKRTKPVYWELRDKNANDGEVLSVMKKAVKPFEDGDTLLWDRLGRSGTSVHPKAQHYNPTVKDILARKGVKVVHLPPKGKWLNPIELLFNDLKSHHLRKGGGRQHGSLTFRELKSAIDRYMKEVAPNNLPGFFRSRANGREMIRQGLLK